MNTLPYVYAALLDVLGYRDRLDRDRINGTLDFKNVLENSLRCLSTVNDAEFAHQAISDTIILTCTDREKLIDFLKVLRDVQLAFLENGLFLRGGLTFQQHFRSGSITYSPAYAGAHEIETKIAIYPRIVVDHNIIEMYESSERQGPLSASGLLCHCNGVCFLNILTQHNWQNVYAQSRRLYEADSARMKRNEGVFSKHFWFQEYLFSSVYAADSAQRYIPSIRVWASPEG